MVIKTTRKCVFGRERGEGKEGKREERGSERLRKQSNEGTKLLVVSLDQSIWLLNYMDSIQLMGKASFFICSYVQ